MQFLSQISSAVQAWQWYVKLGIVIGGYLLAVGFAIVVTVAYIATEPPDAQASQGMLAFGESLVTMGAFGLAAIIPSGLALYFLRPYERFWAIFSIVAVVFALTGFVGIAGFAWSQRESNDVALFASLFGILRVGGAPIFFVGDLVFTVFAPSRRSRLTLIGAALIEMVTGTP